MNNNKLAKVIPTRSNDFLITIFFSQPHNNERGVRRISTCLGITLVSTRILSFTRKRPSYKDHFLIVTIRSSFIIIIILQQY